MEGHRGKIAVFAYTPQKELRDGIDHIVKSLGDVYNSRKSYEAANYPFYELNRHFKEIKRAIAKGKVGCIILAGGHWTACHQSGFQEIVEVAAKAGRDLTVIFPLESMYGAAHQWAHSEKKGEELIKASQLGGFVRMSELDKAEFADSIKRGFVGSYLKWAKSVLKSHETLRHTTVTFLAAITRKDNQPMYERFCYVHPSFEVSYDGELVYKDTEKGKKPLINVQILTKNEDVISYVKGMPLAILPAAKEALIVART
jgi:hypothetical protein